MTNKWHCTSSEWMVNCPWQGWKIRTAQLAVPSNLRPAQVQFVLHSEHGNANKMGFVLKWAISSCMNPRLQQCKVGCTLWTVAIHASIQHCWSWIVAMFITEMQQAFLIGGFLYWCTTSGTCTPTPSVTKFRNPKVCVLLKTCTMISTFYSLDVWARPTCPWGMHSPQFHP